MGGLSGTLAQRSPPVPDPSPCPVWSDFLGLACWLHTCIGADTSTACGFVVIEPNRGCILKEEGVELSLVK